MYSFKIIQFVLLRLITYWSFVILLFNPLCSLGDDCDNPLLESGYEKLYKLVDAQEPVKALSFADSILSKIEKGWLEHCPRYLWIKYEKGEALELLRNRSEEVLSLYHDLVKEAEASRNWELLAETFISIARTHETIGRPEDCRRYLDFALKIIDKYQVFNVYSRYAVRYASYHRIYKNRDTARVYAEQAIKYGKYYNVQRSEMDGYLLSGILEEDLEKSVGHFQNAVDFCLERKTYYGAASLKMNIVKRYLKAGDLENAQKQLAPVQGYIDKTPENYIGYHSINNYYFELKSVIFEKQKKIDSAFYYLKKATDAAAQASFRVNQADINEKETIRAIEREQVKLELEQQQTYSLRIGLAMFALASILLGITYFKNARQKDFISGQNKLIARQNEELNEALRYQTVILSEIHHRVKNNLQLVMSLLILKGQKIASPEVKIHLDELSNKVFSIALIHQQLYQSKEFEKIDLNAYINELFSYYSTLQNETQPFSFELHSEPYFLNLETVLPLGIICSELISNSLKYALIPDQVLFLKLSFQKEKEKYLFRYQDNGPGYNNRGKQNTRGMGEMLIKSMVRQLNAESNTSNENGAVFELTFTEKYIAVV